MGSTLAIDASTALVLMTTTLGGIVGWMVVEKLGAGYVTAFGLAYGAIGSLVGITSAAAFVGPFGAIAIGFLASISDYSNET